MSSQTPIDVRNRLASEAFESFSTSLLTTSGSLRSSSNLWPRFLPTWSDAVAAIAALKASLFSFWLICLTSVFDVTGGNAILPLTVPGANAALPDKGPCPPIRGTLDIPLPTPNDSAVVLFHAFRLLPCSWQPWGFRAIADSLLTCTL